MVWLKSLIILFTYVLITSVSLAQEATGEIEMADAMRESGKIYVVVAVLLAIFIGIVVYLVVIDRKISRLEKSIKK